MTTSPDNSTLQYDFKETVMARTTTFGNTSVFVMFLLTVVTLGIYPLVWFRLRRELLEQLDTPSPFLRHLFTAAVLCFISSLGAAVVIGAFEGANVGGPLYAFLSFLDRALGIADIVLFCILSFMVRRILHEHFNDRLKLRVRLSKILTLIFGPFYLQYKMNRLPAPHQPSDEGDPHLAERIIT